MDLPFSLIHSLSSDCVRITYGQAWTFGSHIASSCPTWEDAPKTQRNLTFSSEDTAKTVLTFSSTPKPQKLFVARGILPNLSTNGFRSKKCLSPKPCELDCFLTTEGSKLIPHSPAHLSKPVLWPRNEPGSLKSLPSPNFLSSRVSPVSARLPLRAAFMP